MKLCKLRTVLLACLTALMAVSLCLGFAAANRVRAFAKESDSALKAGEVDFLYPVGSFSYYGENGLSLSDGFRFSEASAENLIYSAEFAPDNAEAQAAGLVFGVSDDLTAYWVASSDTRDGLVKLWQSEAGELKTADYRFEAGEKFKITVVVNEGVAKIFMDNNDVAVITCKLDDYRGGKVGLNAIGGDFKLNNVKLTNTDSRGGGIFCNGYEVLKVVNLTDGNCRLKSGEFSMKGGVLTVSEEYLRTLEADTEYLFRVVTSFTDFNFKLTTDFTSVTAAPVIEKYYRGSDVTFELGSNVKVHRLLIDGKEFAFTQTEERIVISSEEVEALSTGKHSVKLYTDMGRPETTFTVAELMETLTELQPEATHMFFWIDIAIFGALIVGYLAFSFIRKRKK